MFGSVVIDVGIGLVFIYLLLALLCMVAHEWIAGLLSLRAKTLDAGVQKLLGRELAQEFYEQPLIRSLSAPDGKPSYVPAHCLFIVTYDIRDFVGAEKFGLSVLEPGPFLVSVGVLK